MMKSRKEKWFSNIYIYIYISTDEQISRHFGKASVQDKSVCVLKMELMEMNSLLKKEEITPRLGGSIDVLLIYGQSSFSSKNGPGLEVPFQFEKWFEISDGQGFSNLENGLDRMIIFVMKMVR